MQYTIKQFQGQFPDDKACLDYIFKARFATEVCPRCGSKDFYPVKNRKCYACACGYQIYPVAGTIFHKSATKLTDWFFAIYLISTAKNGVSAAELQRHLGVTYKTAWRMAKQIRSLMKQDKGMLGGVIEADEAFIGGRRRSSSRFKNKTPVMGIVQRNGQVRAEKIPDIQTHTLLNMLRRNIKFGSYLMTDDNTIYRKVGRIGLFHDSVNHSKYEYVRGDVHTNTIEGFWSQLKGKLNGTYRHVSPKHLQSYVDESVFSYNQRLSSVSSFETLLSRSCKPYQEGQKMPSFVGVKVSP